MELRLTVMDPQTKKILAQTQAKNVATLLDGKLYHQTVTDRTTVHERLVIEYGHKPKEQ